MRIKFDFQISLHDDGHKPDISAIRGLPRKIQHTQTHKRKLAKFKINNKSISPSLPAKQADTNNAKISNNNNQIDKFTDKYNDDNRIDSIANKSDDFKTHIVLIPQVALKYYYDYVNNDIYRMYKDGTYKKLKWWKNNNGVESLQLVVVPKSDKPSRNYRRLRFTKDQIIELCRNPHITVKDLQPTMTNLSQNYIRRWTRDRKVVYGYATPENLEWSELHSNFSVRSFYKNGDLILNGQKYKSLTDAAKKHHMTYNTLYGRLLRYGNNSDMLFYKHD